MERLKEKERELKDIAEGYIKIIFQNSRNLPNPS